MSTYKFIEKLFEVKQLCQKFLFTLGLKLHYKNEFRVLYKKSPNILAELCDKHGSDKGSIGLAQKPYPWKPHNYTDYYFQLFDFKKEHVKTVFECGIGTNNVNLPSNMSSTGKPGASLRVWRDYFYNAKIYGADVDSEILFKEDRIETYYLNQLDVDSIKNYWNIVGPQKFDIMIDDGLHTFKAGKNLFEHSIHMLKLDGIYIIEDVSPYDLQKFSQFFAATSFNIEIITFKSPQRRFVETSLLAIRKPPSQ
jgi:hypothetical protein